MPDLNRTAGSSGGHSAGGVLVLHDLTGVPLGRVDVEQHSGLVLVPVAEMGPHGPQGALLAADHVQGADARGGVRAECRGH